MEHSGLSCRFADRGHLVSDCFIQGDFLHRMPCRTAIKRHFPTGGRLPENTESYRVSSIPREGICRLWRRAPAFTFRRHHYLYLGAGLTGLRAASRDCGMWDCRLAPHQVTGTHCHNPAFPSFTINRDRIGMALWWRRFYSCSLRSGGFARGAVDTHG